ncbi:hypothetical protein PAMA_006996 [Pampus argenteus]
MEEQGDGSHVGVINAEPPVLSDVGQGGENIYLIFGIAMHPLLLIGQEVFAFFQRRIWDENNLANIVNVVDNGNENDNNNDVDNDNNRQVEDAGGAGAEDDMEFNQHVEEENSLPGISSRRSREKDAGNEENGSKRFRAWRELSDSDSEEDPLPRGSRRRSREKDDGDEESTSSIYFRWWDEFASSDSEDDPLPGGSS